MSTRSGRRIHGSILEPEVAAQEEPVAKSIKKPRNKRVKDTIEVVETTASKSKKRNNYVSYPSDEEVQGAPELPKDKEDEPVRALRKTALKEQNLNITSSETTDVDGMKPARLTRRTKKFAESHENEPEPEKVEEEVPDTVVEKKGKKNKKKKSKTVVPNENEVAVISKKKSKRKKKKSNQESNSEVKNSTSEVKNSTLNGSKMSIDSFHSAAGSPVHVDNNKKLNTTFDKSPEKPKEEIKNVSQTSDRKRRRSSNVINNDLSTNVAVTGSNSKKNLRRNSTFEFVELDSATPADDDTVKDSSPNKKRLKKQNSTFEVIEEPTANPVSKENTPNNRRLTRQNTFEITETKANTTLEKDTQKARRSSIKNSTFDATNSPSKGTKDSTFDKSKTGTPSKLNTTFEKDERRKSLRLSSVATVEKQEQKMNGTFDKNERQSDKLNSTFDKETNLNTTFDKEKDKSDSIKSSLVTSDDTGNLTFDKSDERISITSDDSRIENTTPVLIESSMDESRINTSDNKKSPKTSVPTPMKREGTFTKEDSLDPKVSIESIRTPTKRMSLATPGSTPFPFSKSGQKEKALMNVTRSIEKSRLSFNDVAPSTRTTKVMFCSPVNNPMVVAQQKRKVIKSNLKGSNKSFVFEEIASSPVRAAPRKRSYTHNDVEEARAKRFRHDDQQQSVDRLSKPRSSTTAGKANEPTTPSKRIPTPSKSKSESKVSRTKLPNFAALHQKRFQKMESLDECQERKAKRAKQLLTPSAAINVLERSSPRGTDQAKAKDVKKSEPKEKRPESKVEKKAELRSESKTRIQDPQSKSERPEKVERKDTRSKKPEDTVAKSDPKGLTLESLSRGYTRFGFKMNIGVNPFSIPSNGPSKETKPKEEKPKNGLTRQVTQPSLAGATGARKEAAKQLVMREKSFTRERRVASRNESRTVIKGVRTNRRFELQMQMRNIS